MSLRRARRLLLPLLASASALAAAATPAAATATDAARLTLRLPDLGPGYQVVQDGACSALQVQASNSRTGCDTSFTRAWSTPGLEPGPEFVESAALVSSAPTKAVAEIARPRALASSLLGVARDRFEVVDPGPIVGDGAALLRGADGAAVVVWRSGSTLALVLAFDPRGNRVSAPAALRLAAAQQARIATPTPLLRSDLDDLEVPLDDPALDVDVQWLGRRLNGTGSLPSIGLRDVYSRAELGFHTNMRMELTYGARKPSPTVVVDLWQPRVLRRLVRQDLRRERHDGASCLRRHRMRMDGGRAVIYGRYPDAPPRCHQRPPDSFLAIAFLRGVAAMVTVSPCPRCHSPIMRYNSLAGMRTIVRSLRVREPRATVLPAP